MLLIPGVDGWKTSLQETGYAVASISASDDLAISIRSLEEAAWDVGCWIRVFARLTGSGLVLEAVVRADKPPHAEPLS